MDIDFVIPWVNGADLAWQEKKRKYQKKSGNDIDDSDARYRDWDLLRYWFRGVEKFAPWVRKIYFITDHQVPDWLNTNHPKLVCVKHEDYIPKQYLPVFSSHPIELNMHRIQGLSEHFVYFNDDTFIMAPIQENDFFRKGLPCDYAEESPIAPSHDDVFFHVLLNNIALLNENYSRQEVLKKHRKKFLNLKSKHGFFMNFLLQFLKRDDFFGFSYSHLPSAFLKTTLIKVWENNNVWLNQTCQHRFRSAEDVNQYIFSQYQYVNGLFFPRSWEKEGKAFQIDDRKNGNLKELCLAIEQQGYKMICINEDNVTHFNCTKNRIQKSFNKILFNKSSFEL